MIRVNITLTFVTHLHIFLSTSSLHSHHCAASRFKGISAVRLSDISADASSLAAIATIATDSHSCTRFCCHICFVFFFLLPLLVIAAAIIVSLCLSCNVNVFDTAFFMGFRFNFRAAALSFRNHPFGSPCRATFAPHLLPHCMFRRHQHLCGSMSWSTTTNINNTNNGSAPP